MSMELITALSTVESLNFSGSKRSFVHKHAASKTVVYNGIKMIEFKCLHCGFQPKAQPNMNTSNIASHLRNKHEKMLLPEERKSRRGANARSSSRPPMTSTPEDLELEDTASTNEEAPLMSVTHDESGSSADSSCGSVLANDDEELVTKVKQAAVPNTALEYDDGHVTSQPVTPIGATLPPKMQAHIAQHSQHGGTNRKEQHSLPHDATSTDKLSEDLEYICEHYLLNSQTEMSDAARHDDTNTASPSDNEVSDDGHDEQVWDDSDTSDTPTTIEGNCKKDGSEDTQPQKDDREKGRSFRYDTFAVPSTELRNGRLPSGDAVQCTLPALQCGNRQQVLPVDPVMSHFLSQHTHELGAEHSALSGYVLTQQQRNSAAKGKNAAKDSQQRKKRKHAAVNGTGGKLMRKERDKIPSSSSCNSAILFPSTSAVDPAYVDSLSAHNRRISQKVEDNQLELRDGQAVMGVIHQLPGGVWQFNPLISVSGVVPTTTAVPPDIHSTVQPAVCQLVLTAISTPNTSDQRVGEESSFLDKQEVGFFELPSQNQSAIIRACSNISPDEVCCDGVNSGREELSSLYSQQPSSHADNSDQPTVGAEAMDEVVEDVKHLLDVKPSDPLFSCGRIDDDDLKEFSASDGIDLLSVRDDILREPSHELSE